MAEVNTSTSSSFTLEVGGSNTYTIEETGNNDRRISNLIDRNPSPSRIGFFSNESLSSIYGILAGAQ